MEKQKRCKDCYWKKICFDYLKKYDSGFKKDYKTADECPVYKRKWYKFGRTK